MSWNKGMYRSCRQAKNSCVHKYTTETLYLEKAKKKSKAWNMYILKLTSSQ